MIAETASRPGMRQRVDLMRCNIKNLTPAVLGLPYQMRVLIVDDHPGGELRSPISASALPGSPSPGRSRTVRDSRSDNRMIINDQNAH